MHGQLQPTLISSLMRTVQGAAGAWEGQLESDVKSLTKVSQEEWEGEASSWLREHKGQRGIKHSPMNPMLLLWE